MFGRWFARHHEIDVTILPDEATRSHLDRLTNMLRNMQRSLDRIERKVDTIMATLADFETKFAELDAATNQIAADLTALKDQIANGGLSAETESAVLATLDTKIAALKALASTPPA